MRQKPVCVLNCSWRHKPGTHTTFSLLWSYFYNNWKLKIPINTIFVYYPTTTKKKVRLVLHLVRWFLLFTWGYGHYRILVTIKSRVWRAVGFFLTWYITKTLNTKKIYFKCTERDISGDTILNFSNKSSYFGFQGFKIPFRITRYIWWSNWTTGQIYWFHIYMYLSIQKINRHFQTLHTQVTITEPQENSSGPPWR